MINKKTDIKFKREIGADLNRKYREPIEIQKKEEAAQREDGTWSSGGWTPFKKVFANIHNLKGAEKEAARQNHKEESVRFFIRFIPGIENQVKEEYRVLYRGKTYNIDFVENVNNQDKELEIRGLERRLTDGSE